MGDIAKKPKAKKTMEERVEDRENKKKEKVHFDNQTIDKLASRPVRKNKQISARVNEPTYINFKKICVARGITSNACLNMLITDFVREHKWIIEEK